MTEESDNEPSDTFEEQLAGTTDPIRKADLLLCKAVALFESGEFSEARNYLELAIKEAPDDPSVQLGFDYINASILDDEGKNESALLCLTELLQKRPEQLREPGNRDVYEAIQQRRSDANLALRHFEDAIPILEELLTFDLVDLRRARNLANLGFAYFEVKDFMRAQITLLRALEFKHPDNWIGLIRLYLGLTYANLKQLREAEKELLLCAEHAHEWNLSLTNTYGWLSRIYKHLGDAARSREYERLALTV